MALEFGIWDHFERQDGIPISQQYEERIQLIVAAEALGFSGYHVAEHHLTPLDMAPSPTVFLAAVAERTSRIRLGSMVLCLPLYHPVRLIQEICMLDQLSAGRFEPGVGRGVRDVEHEWFGVDPTEAHARFDETLEVLVDSLSQGRLEHHGRFYQFDDVPLHCETYQQPLPPFWYAGNFQYAAEHAMNALGRATGPEPFEAYWRTWEAGRAAGKPGYQRQPKVGSTRHLVLADSDDQARTIARRAWNVYQDHFFTTSVRNLGRDISRKTSVSAGGDADLRMDAGSLLAGSPATVLSALNAFVDQVGPGQNYLVGAFQWGDITHTEALRSLHLYATEIMPVLAGASVGVGV